ncbi:MAG: hypothetical protein ACM4AI_09360 [Acidobacteriota bacterium]
MTRRVIGYGAILCALPYLALKLIWLAGGNLGIADPGLMHEPTMVALNVVTAFMDVVAVAIALAFTHDWGLRIPAWLVLPPMWVATGLLVRFVVTVPFVAASMAFARESIRVPPGGPVEPWVYAVVYSGFTGMGIGLMIAFILYARARWHAVFDAASTRSARVDFVRAVSVPLAIAGALLALAGSVPPLAWTFGSTVGIRADLVTGRTFASSLSNAADALMGLGAAAGVMTMVRGPRSRVPSWLAVAVTWIGSGSLFSWGLWHLINLLGNTPLVRERLQGMGLVNLMSLVRFIAGLVIGVVLLLVAAERQDAAGEPRTALP